MGLTAVFYSASEVAGVRLGSGSILVSALLVYLLAYLNVVEASKRRRRQLQALLVVAVIPLSMVFIGIIITNSLAAIDTL